MSPAPRRGGPATGAVYEVRVAGHLDEHWAGRLGTADVVRSPDGTTTFVVTARDQAAVHGVLTLVRDIGATLLSVQRTDAPPPRGAGAPA